MKKTMGIIVGILLVIVGVLSLVFVVNKKQNNLQTFRKEESKRFGDILLECLKDTNTSFDTFNLSKNAKESIEEYKRYLLSLNDTVYIIETAEERKEEAEIEEELCAPDEVDINGNVIKNTENTDNIEDYELEKDENLFEDAEGNIAIKVSDLVFDGNVAYVNVGGGYKEVYKEDVEMTYDMLKDYIQNTEYSVKVVVSKDKAKIVLAPTMDNVNVIHAYLTFKGKQIVAVGVD